MGKEATASRKIRGLVCLRGHARDRPVAPSKGCPVNMGHHWTLAEMDVTIERGTHVSVLKDDAIQQIHKETCEKEKQGFVKIYKWDDLRANLADHPQLTKLSPLAIIPHKSRK